MTALADIQLGPQELAIFIGAAVVAALSLLGLLFIERRDASLQNRIDSLQNVRRPIIEVDEPLMPEVQRRWYHELGDLIGASPLVGDKERQKVAATLANAGIHGGAAVAIFIAVKFATLAAALLGTWTLLEGFQLLADAKLLRTAPVLLAAIIGWRLPDMVVAILARRRRAALEAGLPDALDLLVICAEAGLALEKGIERVSRDLAGAHPVLSQELAVTVAEMRVLPERRIALEHLAARSGLASFRSVVATLAQTVKYGTPLAHSLRILASEMRTARMLRIEERAARLPALLTVPLIAFILPCLFVVVAGPAALDLIDLMK